MLLYLTVISGICCMPVLPFRRPCLDKVSLESLEEMHALLMNHEVHSICPSNHSGMKRIVIPTNLNTRSTQTAFRNELCTVVEVCDACAVHV